jgi:EAL domain-containing protein (putative c-di-GMP-specific phosphodiesterase class I)/ActR/RegA family two-component response regulator
LTIARGATAVQTVMVIDDDPTICAGLAAGMEVAGRHLIVCRDLESAKLMLELFLVTHVLSDVKFSGPFRFEGLDLVDLVRQSAPAASVMLMTGYASEELRNEALTRGARALLEKPVSLTEIDRFIPAPEHGGESVVTIVPTLDDVLDSGMLFTRFQPLVWIEKPIQALGFEALTRLSGESPFGDPELLFRYAAAKGRIVDLELAAAAASLKAGTGLTGIGFIGINIHPSTFNEVDRLCDGILDAAAEAGVSPARLVLEITEQGPLPALGKVEAVTGMLRAQGVRFAFDDVGSAYSHLNSIAAVRPSYLKISQQFGTGCESNDMHRKIVANVQNLAHSFSSELLLEGIETARTATFARETGIRLGQGYLYSRPTDAESLIARYS